RGGNRNRAVVGNVDLRASLFDERSDHLAAWSNDVANLVRINLDLNDAWRKLRYRFAWIGQCLLHDTQNVDAAFFRLFERFGHDLRIDAGDLDVHLQRRDAVASAGDFEVH